jgi:Poly(ADP-ribose) polymerase and DNA-Ligase Zn-finger region
MAHVIEPAASARAKCRGCDRKIEKGELRFGERHPNAFGEGEMTLWFHLVCAAYKRPESLLDTLDACATAGEAPAIENADALRAAAELGVAHRRLPRINGAERAPTGRARCRSCREFIAKDEWRVALVFFEEYRFQPSGFVHAGCAQAYFGTTDLIDRVRHFAPKLEPDDLDSLQAALQ